MLLSEDEETDSGFRDIPAKLTEFWEDINKSYIRGEIDWYLEAGEIYTTLFVGGLYVPSGTVKLTDIEKDLPEERRSMAVILNLDLDGNDVGGLEKDTEGSFINKFESAGSCTIIIGFEGEARKLTVRETFTVGKPGDMLNLSVFGDIVVLTGLFDVYGGSDVEGVLDLRGTEGARILLKGNMNVGGLYVADCTISAIDAGLTLTITGKDENNNDLEKSLIIDEQLIVLLGNIVIKQGDLEMLPGTTLTMNEGKLEIQEGDLIVGADSILQFAQGNVIVNGNVLMEGGTMLTLSKGDLIVNPYPDYEGSTRVGGGNIYALDTPEYGADIWVQGGTMHVDGDVSAKSLRTYFGATIGGDLIIGVGIIDEEDKILKGLSIYEGDLTMLNGGLLQLHSPGVVAGSIISKGEDLEIDVRDGHMLTAGADLIADNVELSGLLTVVGKMDVIDTFTMNRSWASLGPDSFADNVLVTSSATLLGTLHTKELKLEGPAGRLNIMGIVDVEGDINVEKGAFLVVSSVNDLGGDYILKGVLRGDHLTVEGRLDVLHDGELYLKKELTVKGAFNMDGTFEAPKMTVTSTGVANVSGYATLTSIVDSTGLVLVSGGILDVSGELNIGPYGPYASSRAPGKSGFVIEYDPSFDLHDPVLQKTADQFQLWVREGGVIYVYGTLDASGIPHYMVNNEGEIWAWNVGSAKGGLGADDGPTRDVIPFGTGLVNYFVDVYRGENAVGSTVAFAQHTQELIVTVEHEYGYAIQGVTVTMRGVPLVEGVHFIFDRNTVTVFADAIDGETGDIVIDITNAYQPTSMDLVIQLVLLGGMFLLFLLFLLFLKRRRKKKTAIIKRYY
jgi:hypothetical protein